MKTIKRVFAILITMLLIAGTAVIAASAATYKMTVECDKKDYVFTVYQIASLDDETGTYTCLISDEAVKAEVLKSESSTVGLLDACDSATDLGTAVGTYDTTADGASKTFSDLEGGIYYIKCTAVAVNNKSVKNSIAVLPNSLMTDDTFKFSVGSKVPENDEPGVSKKIVVGDTLVDSSATGQDKTIVYQLSADIAGSVSNKLASFVITDKMDGMLDKDAVAVKSVQLAGADIKYSVSNDPAVINSDKSKDNTFGIVIDPEELEKDSFYTEGNKVVVRFETKLASSAVSGVKIINSDDLIYQNKSGRTFTVEGNDVDVYTFNIQIKKVDSENASTTLSKAQFAVYDSYDSTTKTLGNKIADSAETGDDGIAAVPFLFAPGKYYIQETKAPEGYNLDTSVHEITVEDDFSKAVQLVATVKDTKAKLPQTGGSGTMVFTIMGGALILIAGVMFVLVMRKKSK